ncbi:SMP-30/gluconolactonase/LRE family protein [Pseudomonas sp.]|uniref:Vgb family protein n=1 Tax=Pseudomonas sp. TaxID=306 RepID=UPI002907FD6E|nr:SMP-30/gluconolactonase/LRE family protein [Pseudomonas sp.]MDU4252048.1 SMP-30/gluconolactonase/LRE family protein [Pseudomonas sp.]
MLRVLSVLLTGLLLAASAHAAEVKYFDLPKGSGPHDVAPTGDGKVWYTAQKLGVLGRLDPQTGQTEQVSLGKGSSPHGVISDGNGDAWITDSGQNAIVHVDALRLGVEVIPLPKEAANANLNTAVFDDDGVLWFTGQNGFYGRLDPDSRDLKVWPAPRGKGPYGIAVAPDGGVWYTSLAGNYLGRIDGIANRVTPYDAPSPEGGPRRLWADSVGRLWVSQWNAGSLARFDPSDNQWKTWQLPGDHPQPYAVYVDTMDQVWLSDFSANALLRFDPQSETFTAFPSDHEHANVRQLLGRPGEVWGAESGTDRLVLIRD